MKKIIFLIVGFLFFLFYSCTDQSVVDLNSMDGERVTFHMGVKVSDTNPLQSRASFYEIPSVKDPLWVIVFDEYGYLVELAKATNLKENSDGKIDFDVILQSSLRKRILHFLFGYPNPLQLNHDNESNFIGKLVVDGKRGVYWQRKEVDKLTETSVVDPNDPKNNLLNVPLLRNFAEITIENKDPEHFQLDGYYVIHAINSGTVAPYTNGNFVNYLKGDGSLKSYDELLGEKYTGYLPKDVEYSLFPDNDDQIPWTNTEKNIPPIYSYEHKLTHDTKARKFAILLKGKYRKDTNTNFKDIPLSYYKLDIANYDKGQIILYNILRNFRYKVEITKVHGTGKVTANEAYRHAAQNNISASVALSNLVNISDGEAALFISFIDTVLVTTNPIQLKYKFIEDVKNPNNTNNKSVEFTLKNEEDEIIFDKIDANDQKENDWATLQLVPIQQNVTHPIVQRLVVYEEGHGLSREIRIELRPKLKMEVQCTPNTISSKPNARLKVNIKIPDQLTKRFFPLKFQIDSQATNQQDFLAKYISPHWNDYMSTVLDYSLIPKFKNIPSYYYEKVITYDEYKDLKKTEDGLKRIVTCNFVTTHEDNASIVYVTNKYFTNDSVWFYNDSKQPILEIKPTFIEGNLSPKLYGEGWQFDFNLAVTVPGNYTISSNGTLKFYDETNVKFTDKLSLHLNAGTFPVHCKTQTWDKPPLAYITYDDDPIESPVDLEGDTRTLLRIQTKLDPNSTYQPKDDETIQFHYKKANGYLDKIEDTWENWKKGKDIQRTNLNKEYKFLKWHFQTKPKGFWSPVYQTTEIKSTSAEDITKNVLILNFHK